MIFGGNALGWFDIDIFFDGWWTLFIIVPSAMGLITEKEKLSSLVMLAVGVILLLAAQGVFSWDMAWKVILAVVLMMIGIGIIVKSDRAYNEEVFTGSNLVAVFGGVDLDFRKAKFTKDTIIRAFCLFGGIDIKLPEDVQVKMRSRFIFGGASDERKGDTSKGKYTVYLDAAGGFGRISVRSMI